MGSRQSWGVTEPTHIMALVVLLDRRGLPCGIAFYPPEPVHGFDDFGGGPHRVRPRSEEATDA